MACATTAYSSDVPSSSVASGPLVKRQRVTFSVALGSQNQGGVKSRSSGSRSQRPALSCFAASSDDIEDEETTLSSTPSAPSRPSSSSLPSLKTSSEAFEKFRGSLKAKHGPLFTQYAALISSERGLSSGADRDLDSLGLTGIGQVVEAMVQLADLRLEQQSINSQHASVSRDAFSDEELVNVACELFETLCTSVRALTADIPGLAATPPEVYMEVLQKQWGGVQEGGVEVGAARAAALFRMKDTVSSLYAWGLVTRAAAMDIISAIQEIEFADSTCGSIPDASKLCFLDPVSGTGLHGAIFRHLGAAIVMADYVAGGTTQTSGSDMQYLLQRNSGTSSSRIVSSKLAVEWLHSENRDVFDDSADSQEWWHSNAMNTALFLSFPPPPPSTVAEVALRRFQGNWLVFVGEWRGCTGTSAFFDELDTKWKVIRKVELPRWPMMDDWAWVLQRREAI